MQAYKVKAKVFGTMVLVFTLLFCGYNPLPARAMSEHFDDDLSLDVSDHYALDIGSIPEDKLTDYINTPKGSGYTYSLAGGSVRLVSSDDVERKINIDHVVDEEQTIKPSTWYKVEVEGETTEHAVAEVAFKEYKGRAFLISDNFEIENGYAVVKTTADSSHFNLVVGVKGQGTLRISKVTVSEIIPPVTGVMNDPAEITDYYTANENPELMANLSKNMLPGPLTPDYREEASKIVSDGVIGLPPYKDYALGENWGNGWLNYSNRTQGRLLHGFFFLPDMVEAYQESNDAVYITTAFAIIKNWVEQNPYRGPDQSSMAWHDETTARRMLSWIVYYDAARPILTPEQLSFLYTQMKITADVLSSRNFYTSNHNHGMFQDQALIAYSVYFSKAKDSQIYKALAETRMKEYFNFIFSAEGVHLEHSPAYHYILAINLLQYSEFFKASGDPFAEYILKMYNKMASFGTQIIMPDGKMPPIGDTAPGPVSPKYWPNNPTFMYAVSKGSSGTAPKTNDIVYPEAGYAIFRNSWALKEKATYVLFQAAYHNNNHKQQDDLNVLIYSNGDIISEAGPYGYDYKNDNTTYAYSSFAHNVLIVDHKSLQLDNQFTKTKILNYTLFPGSPSVTGENARFKDVVQQRKVTYKEQKDLVEVKDTITSVKNHQYELLWNLAPDIESVITGNNVKLYRNKEKVMEIHMTSDHPFKIKKVHGQKKPQMLGFTYNKFYDSSPEANDVLVVDFQGSGQIQMSTQFQITRG